jgi:hypothetical protein
LTRAAERPAKTPSMKAKRLHEAPAKVEKLHAVSGVHETRILCGSENPNGQILYCSLAQFFGADHNPWNSHYDSYRITGAGHPFCLLIFDFSLLSEASLFKR